MPDPARYAGAPPRPPMTQRDASCDQHGRDQRLRRDVEAACNAVLCPIIGGVIVERWGHRPGRTASRCQTRLGSPFSSQAGRWWSCSLPRPASRDMPLPHVRFELGEFLRIDESRCRARGDALSREASESWQPCPREGGPQHSVLAPCERRGRPYDDFTSEELSCPDQKTSGPVASVTHRCTSKSRRRY